MTRLILLDGPPGAGKSTLARQVAELRPFALALDIDRIKHALGSWDRDPGAAGLHARRLALAVIREQLDSGRDVVVGQYLARTAFIEQLEDVAAQHGAEFVELLLTLSPETLSERLQGRAERGTLPEHAINAALVAPQEAPAMIDSLRAVREARPGMIEVDAEGGIEAVLERISQILGR